MAVYEDSMVIENCDSMYDILIFSLLEDIGFCNRNIAYLMKEKKVLSYDEDDFEWGNMKKTLKEYMKITPKEDMKITLKEDKIITLKKMRNLINRGFDAQSAYLLETEGYGEIAIDLINEQMPYDEIIDILLLQDSDKNVGCPVMDEKNKKRYEKYIQKGHKAIDTLVLLKIIEADYNVFESESEFHTIFEENGITLRNINRMVLEDIESKINWKYKLPYEKEIIAGHISLYIKSGIDPVSAARKVIDAEIDMLKEKHDEYKLHIKDKNNRYSHTEAFEKVFGTENLTR